MGQPGALNFGQPLVFVADPAFVGEDERGLVDWLIGDDFRHGRKGGLDFLDLCPVGAALLDEVAALRTYTIPSPLKGQYASADFLLLLGDNHAEDVRWLKGDEELKKATPALLAATYRAPLPTGSEAKILRRGILACTTGSKTCLLVLLPAGQAQMDQ